MWHRCLHSTMRYLTARIISRELFCKQLRDHLSGQGLLTWTLSSLRCMRCLLRNTDPTGPAGHVQLRLLVLSILSITPRGMLKRSVTRIMLLQVRLLTTQGLLLMLTGWLAAGIVVQRRAVPLVVVSLMPQDALSVD